MWNDQYKPYTDEEGRYNQNSTTLTSSAPNPNTSKGAADAIASFKYPSPMFQRNAGQNHGDFSVLESTEEDISNRIVSSAGQTAYSHAANIGNKLLEEGNKLLQSANLIGEGPKPLRAMCFLGGLAITVCSFAYVFFVFSFLTGPAIYVLHCYEALFGIVVMIIEAKDMNFLARFKSFVAEWLKFMTVPGGKGAFYFFIGSLGMSMFGRNIPLFVVGVYMTIMGIIGGLVHFGLERQLRQSGIRIDDDESLQELHQAANPPAGTLSVSPYAAIPPVAIA